MLRSFAFAKQSSAFDFDVLIAVVAQMRLSGVKEVGAKIGSKFTF